MCRSVCMTILNSFFSTHSFPSFFSTVILFAQMRMYTLLLFVCAALIEVRHFDYICFSNTMHCIIIVFCICILSLDDSGVVAYGRTCVCVLSLFCHIICKTIFVEKLLNFGFPHFSLERSELFCCVYA